MGIIHHLRLELKLFSKSNSVLCAATWLEGPRKHVHQRPLVLHKSTQFSSYSRGPIILLFRGPSLPSGRARGGRGWSDFNPPSTLGQLSLRRFIPQKTHSAIRRNSQQLTFAKSLMYSSNSGTQISQFSRENMSPDEHAVPVRTLTS